MRLIPKGYEAIAVAVALLAGFAAAGGAGYQVGAMAVEADWSSAKIAQANAQLLAVRSAVARNEAARQKDISATRITLATYERNLDEAEKRVAAERAAADRLRLRVAVPVRVCTPTGAGEAASPIVADGAGITEEVELPAGTERGLRDLAQGADYETERLRAKVAALQDWAHRHGFYEVNP